MSWLKRMLALLVSARVFDLECELAHAHRLARTQAHRIEELELHVLALQSPQGSGDTW